MEGSRWWGAGVSALTLILVLIRLGGSSLWSDEAYTGLLGAHILKYGLPRVSDGLLTIHWVPGDARSGVWIWDGWLQFYLSAAGQEIFGRTALGARFVHALVGALIPWAAYSLFRSMSSRPWVAEAATLLTGLSVPLLLYIRQARYYPEGTLLCLVSLRVYLDALRGRRRAAPMLALVLLLLFHANFIWAALLGSCLAVHLLVVRPSRSILARLWAAFGAAILLAAPFAIWARIWDRRLTSLGTPMGPKDPYFALAHLRYFLIELNLHGAPIVGLLVAGALASWREHRPRAIFCALCAAAFPFAVAGPSTALGLWIFAAFIAIAGLFAILVLLSDASRPRSQRGEMPGALVGLLLGVFPVAFAATAVAPFLRYLVPLFPVLALLTSASVFTILPWRRTAWLAVVAIALCPALSVWPLQIAERADVQTVVADRLLAWNFPSGQRLTRLGVPSLEAAVRYTGWRPEEPISLAVRSPFLDYLHEIAFGFRGPIDAIVAHLNANKRPGDRFYTPYGEYPIAFHTGLAPQAYEPDTPPPRWVILREGRPLRDPILGGDQDIRSWLDSRPYREIVLDAVDTLYQNRPDPDVHRFSPARQGPRVRIRERSR